MKLETSVELLDRVRARHSVSWYGLAKLIPAAENTVANWRHGRSTVDRKFVNRVAELLEESPEYVLLCVEAERETSPELRRIWQRIAAKFRSQAASILLGLLVFPTLAAPGIQGGWGAIGELIRVHCILWKIARARRRRLQFAL